MPKKIEELVPLGGGLYAEVAEYQGRVNLHIRYFYKRDESSDNLYPEKKGIVYDKDGWDVVKTLFRSEDWRVDLSQGNPFQRSWLFRFPPNKYNSDGSASLQFQLDSCKPTYLLTLKRVKSSKGKPDEHIAMTLDADQWESLRNNEPRIDQWLKKMLEGLRDDNAGGTDQG